MVHDGVGWCKLVYGGAGKFHMVHGGAGWCTMVQDDPGSTTV